VLGELVADFEASDLAQREFTTERGIPFSDPRNWIYKRRMESRPLVPEPPRVSGQVSERGAPPADSRLLPVRVVASASKSRTTVPRLGLVPRWH
jgi:hypothetical protein